MDKVYIVYWSMTGNTEAMAQAVADGVTDAGKEAVLRRVDEIGAAELSEQPAFALGCPAMREQFPMCFPSTNATSMSSRSSSILDWINCFSFSSVIVISSGSLIK